MTFSAISGVLSAALNKVKDAYLWLVDWIDQNPQKALWIAFALIVGGVVV